MRFRDVLGFASRALEGHRLRTSLSLLGVAIGVSAVIVLTSLGEGARLYVIGEFSSLGTNLIIVLPGKTETTGLAPIMGGTPRDLTLEDAEAILRRVRPVRRVAPLVLGTAAARHRERSRQVTVLGTTSDWLALRGAGVRVGRFLPPGETEGRVCVIGSTVRAELLPGVNPLGRILRIGDERYRIIGVTAPQGMSIGLDLNEVVYIPVESAMSLFDRTTLFRIFAEVASHEEIPAAEQRVVEVLAERHGVEDVTIVTQESVISTFGRILSVLTAALVGIAAVSLTVAGVGIMNVMLVSVSERTREIGLLKALGATRAQVLGVFLAEAAILSTSGGLAGLAAGYGATRLIRAIYPVFPAQPPVWAVAGAVLVSLAVGMIFGALPARRAARLDPVAALARR